MAGRVCGRLCGWQCERFWAHTERHCRDPCSPAHSPKLRGLRDSSCHSDTCLHTHTDTLTHTHSNSHTHTGVCVHVHVQKKLSNIQSEMPWLAQSGDKEGDVPVDKVFQPCLPPTPLGEPRLLPAHPVGTRGWSPGPSPNGHDLRLPCSPWTHLPDPQP